MLVQALEFSRIASNTVIKIPIQGPKDELENLKVVNILEIGHGIKVNVTACMSAQQCLMAALAGTSYVSLFGGRVNDLGHSAVEEIKKIRQLFDKLDKPPKLIIGSTREGFNVVEWLLAGADIVTVTPNLMKRLIIHPHSKITVQQFLEDAKYLK